MSLATADDYPPRRNRPTMRELLDEIAARHGLTVAELRAPGQRREVSDPRLEFYVEAHAFGYSNQQIANFAGRRCHTTVTKGRKSRLRKLGLA